MPTYSARYFLLLFSKNHIYIFLIDIRPRGFPGGLVVRIWCFHCHGQGFNPWWGNWDPTSCTPWPKFKKRKLTQTQNRSSPTLSKKFRREKKKFRWSNSAKRWSKKWLWVQTVSRQQQSRGWGLWISLSPHRTEGPTLPPPLLSKYKELQCLLSSREMTFPSKSATFTTGNEHPCYCLKRNNEPICVHQQNVPSFLWHSET